MASKTEIINTLEELWTADGVVEREKLKPKLQHAPVPVKLLERLNDSLSSLELPSLTDLQALRILGEFVEGKKVAYRKWSQTGNLAVDSCFGWIWEGIENKKRLGTGS